MVLAMFLMLAMITFAVPAKPGLKRTLTLTDGTTVSAVLVGDEHGHFWRGADGKSYQLVAGSDVFQEVNGQEIIQKAKQRRAKANQRRTKRLAPQKVGSVGAITGQKKGLIILVNYTDVTFQSSNNKALYQRIANEENFTYTVNSNYSFKGSMYDYFKAQSEGLFELTFDVVGPVTVSNTQAYYGGNDNAGDDLRPGAMVKEALAKVDSQVNFADYDWDNDGKVDQVYIIYAGNGEADSDVDDSIWPHAWDLVSATGSSVNYDGKTINTYACGGELNGDNVISGIGTMCHEFSHCLGYPDFYDTDYSGGQGMGYWDLMDSGSYNDDGYQPAGYTSYERWVAGWKTPTELVNTQTVSNMAALQTSGSNTYIIYNKGNNNEYFLLENRQKTGWDTSLPGKGLLILHVDYDENVWADNEPNDDPGHQRMTWIPADNDYQYETYNGTKYYTSSGMKNDPFPYGSVNAFNKSTTPAATLYNKNSDNTYYLDSSVESITQNSDGTISFDFVGISNVATPTFSPAAGQYADAQTVTISCETTGATIYYTLDGTTPTTSSSVYSSALTISETTTVKAMAVKDSEQSAVATAKYTIGGNTSDPNTKKFKLVTSTDNLESGMRYIIACGSQAKAAGDLNSSYLSPEDVTVSSDEITIGDDVAVFVLEGDQTNGWTFKNEDNNQYLYSSAAKSVGYSTTASTWTLSNGTNGVKMTYSTSSYGSLQYNSSSPRFTTYTSSQTEANLYMEYTEKELQNNAITDINDTYTIDLANNESQVNLSAAAATSGATVQFEVTNSTVPTGNYSLANGVLTVSHNGIITIRAYVNADSEYKAAEKVVTVTVIDNPVIAYDGATETTAYGTAYTVEEGLIEGGAVTLTSSNTAVATVEGLTITPVAVGSTTITINTAVTDIYHAGTATFTLTVTAPEGLTTALPSTSGLLFGESFGNNSGSARAWDDSYSVKSGVAAVYSGITGYTISNAKQSKNTGGYTNSGLIQTTSGTDAYIIIGPLNVNNYSSLALTYQWKASSIKGTYTTKAYYATSSTGTYTEVSGTGAGATSFVERSYSLPAAAEVSTLYLKIVWNTSNTQGVIDEVQLSGEAKSSEQVTLNTSGYATYCSMYPLDFSDYDTADYSAWQITNVDSSTGVITFSQVKDKVKGGTGLLFKGTASDPRTTITLTSADSDNELSNNLLVGTLAPTYAAENTYYGLSGNQFKKVNPGTVPSGKALLPASVLSQNSSIPARLTFVFEDETTTGIINVTEKANDNWYDLQGRKIENRKSVNRKLRRGLYIMNGKKVVLK